MEEINIQLMKCVRHKENKLDGLHLRVKILVHLYIYWSESDIRKEGIKKHVFFYNNYNL